jgi:hypothetical protein
MLKKTVDFGMTEFAVIPSAYMNCGRLYIGQVHHGVACPLRLQVIPSGGSGLGGSGDGVWPS